MKNWKHYRITAVLIAIALILAITACSDGGGGGDGTGGNNNNNTPVFQLSASFVAYDEYGTEYKLEMGEGSVSSSMFRAANTAKKGHSYKLTITDEDGTKAESTGTVDDIESLQIDLKHKSSEKIKVGLAEVGREGEKITVMVSFDKDIPIDKGSVRDRPRDMATYNLNSDSNGYILIRGIVKEDGSANIPETFRKLPVTEIGQQAFFYCTNLSAITIPEGVTSIGWDAFRGTSLESVTFVAGSQLTSMRGFNNCTGLKAITIPESVMSIVNQAFQNCTSLTSITIPSSVTSIGWGAFLGCTSLSAVTFAAGSQLQSIDYAVFDGCSSLESITIPSSVTSIGQQAFSYCTSLTSIVIPKSVTSIDFGAFSYCRSLSAITIPTGVTSIGEDTFIQCENLSAITIPASVTSIGERAFTGCKSLSAITIPSNVMSIGDWTFVNCAKLTSVIIPENVTSIGKGVFEYWTSSQTINIRGHANQASADAAWGSNWRGDFCNAVIKYWDGSSYQ